MALVGEREPGPLSPGSLAPGFGGAGAARSGKLDRLVVKSGGRVFFLRLEDIDWIEAAGNYVRLHMGDESHLFRETMTNIEARLDGGRFVRVHRSRIVNTDRIKELQPGISGEYVVLLHNGTRLPLSRGYRDKLQEQLGKRF
jgi:two-component system LytT family response regulator